MSRTPLSPTRSAASRWLLVAAGLAFAVVPAACSSSTPASSSNTTATTTAGATGSTKAPGSTVSTIKLPGAPSIPEPSSTTSSVTSTTAKSTTTSGPTTTQQGPVVDAGMACSVFVTLKSADQDRIVAKIAFDTHRNPVPDGATIVTACQSHPTDSVNTAVACYTLWAANAKVCLAPSTVS